MTGETVKVVNFDDGIDRQPGETDRETRERY